MSPCQWVAVGLIALGIGVMVMVWVLCAMAAKTDDRMGTR